MPIAVQQCCKGEEYSLKTMFIVMGLLATVQAVAQGWILFQNKVSNPPVNAPVMIYGQWWIDPPVGMPVPGGGIYTVELWAGVQPESLAPALNASTGAVIKTLITFDNGYFAGGSHAVQGIPAGVDAYFDVRVYRTADGSWEAGWEKGQSAVFTLQLSQPPNTPAAMVGLQGPAIIWIPEPSILVMGAMGFSAVWLGRRRV